MNLGGLYYVIQDFKPVYCKKPFKRKKMMTYFNYEENTIFTESVRVIKEDHTEVFKLVLLKLWI